MSKWLLALVVLLLASPVFAQRDPGLLPGNTPTTASVGAATLRTCRDGFVVNDRGPGGSLFGTNTEAQKRLAIACTGMVAPGGAGSYNISNAALIANLQAIAPEEAIVQGVSQIETAARRNLRIVGARLAEVRTGAGGLRASGFESTPSGLALAAVPARGGAAGSDDFARLNGFVQGNFHRAKKSETDAEDGFKARNVGVVAGVDYRFRNDFIAGVALNLSRTEATITTAQGGANDANNYGLSLYGSHYRGPWYADAHFNYSRAKFTTSRNLILTSNPAIPSAPAVNAIATGKPSGNQYSIGLATGYNFNLGANTIRPYLRGEYLELKIAGYAESGDSGLELQIESQKLKSLQTALGVQFSRAIGTGLGVLTPYLSVEWNHEFENDTRSLTARYIHDPLTSPSTFAIPTNQPDRNFYTIAAGVSAQLRRGLSAFASAETVQGLSRVSLWGLVLGVKLEF